MRRHALALAVAGACAVSAQALAHELAYSKAAGIRVLVEGTAADWCRPDLALTITRPQWGERQTLEELLAKLPYILQQECPDARVTWRALDGAGSLYASGAGNSASLGSARLVALPAPVPLEAPAGPSAEQERLRQQQALAQVHQRILRRHAQLQEAIRASGQSEDEYLASRMDIRTRLEAPARLLDPSATRPMHLLVHLRERRGDFQPIDYPRPARLLADAGLEAGWHILPVVNLTPFAPLEDGRAIPTFLGRFDAAPEPCRQPRCSERVSLNALLQREFAHSGIDFNAWTPQLSQQFVAHWQRISPPR